MEEQFDIGRWIVITLSLSLSNDRVWHYQGLSDERNEKKTWWRRYCPGDNELLIITIFGEEDEIVFTGVVG